MAIDTDNLRLSGTTTEAEAAGDTARVATLRAQWFDLERRRLTIARTTLPWHQERRRRTPPRLVIDDDLADAWLRGGSLPPR